MKANRVQYLLVVLLLVSCCFGCGRISGRHETARSNYDEKKMAEAEQKGRDTFPQFLDRLRNPQPTDTMFFTKVAIRDGSNVEHMWIKDVKQVGENYVGVISNDPASLRNVKIGQTYPFKLEDVTDWMYFDKGIGQGAFTSRVLIEAETPENAAMMKKRFGWE